MQSSKQRRAVRPPGRPKIFPGERMLVLGVYVPVAVQQELAARGRAGAVARELIVWALANKPR